MAEPDHIFLRPLPNLALGGLPAAFPFFYIKPAEHEKIVRKFYPEENGPVTNIDPIGNSPVIIKKVGVALKVFWCRLIYILLVCCVHFFLLFVLVTYRDLCLFLYEEN